MPNIQRASTDAPGWPNTRTTATSTMNGDQTLVSTGHNNPNDQPTPTTLIDLCHLFWQPKQQKDGRDQSDMVTAHRQEVGQTQLAKGFCDFVSNGFSFPSKHAKNQLTVRITEGCPKAFSPPLAQCPNSSVKTFQWVQSSCPSAAILLVQRLPHVGDIRRNQTMRPRLQWNGEDTNVQRPCGQHTVHSSTL